MAKLNWTRDQKNNFVRDNENLIHSAVHRCKIVGFEYQDLFQEACIGLTKAFESYDDDRKVKFQTYAYKAMMNEVLCYVRKCNAKCRKSNVPVVSFDSDNQSSNGDSMAGYSNKDVSETDYLHSPQTSMEEALEIREIYNKVMELSDQILTSQEKTALMMTVDGHTQSEIADKLQIAQAKVSKITRGAKCKIALYFKRNHIDFA